MGTTFDLSHSLSSADYSADYSAHYGSNYINRPDIAGLSRVAEADLLPCQRDLLWRLGNCLWLRANARGEFDPIFRLSASRKPIQASWNEVTDALFDMFGGKPLVNIEIAGNTLYCYPVQWQLTTLSYRLLPSRAFEERISVSRYAREIRHIAEASAIYHLYINRITGHAWLTFVDYNKDWMP